MVNHAQETIELIDACLWEVSHARHLDILRDISALAVFRASDPKDQFSYDDAIETINVCEAWVESVNIPPQAG